MTSTNMIYNRIIDRIEQTEDYVLGETKVLFIGRLDHSDYYTERDNLPNNGTGMHFAFSTTNYTTLKNYFSDYLDYPINIINKTDIDLTEMQTEIDEMSTFPEKDSIKFIDDILVVKLSDD